MCKDRFLWFRQCRRPSSYTGAVLGQGGMPVVCKDRFLWPRQCRRPSSYTGAVLGHGNMPVVVANSGGASDSAHRPDFGTFPLATVTGTHSANCLSVCSDWCRWSRQCSSLDGLEAWAAHHLDAELRWRFLRALYTGTGPGAVFTGTRLPIIRCIRNASSTEIRH